LTTSDQATLRPRPCPGPIDRSVGVGEDVDRDDPAASDGDRHDGERLAVRRPGRATIAVRGRHEEVRATELDPAERVRFFRDVRGPLARGIPFGVWFSASSMVSI
jgi:hypothetical protein